MIRTGNVKGTSEYTYSGGDFMKKTDFCIQEQNGMPLNTDFVVFFQEQVMALLQERGLLTETQYRKGLILLRERTL